MNDQQPPNPADKPAARRVCLGMPGYGEMSAGASRALWNATQGGAGRLEVDVKYNQSSLLAANFNSLWVWALNENLNRRVHYFAMLHADVEPVDGWLDILINELEARDLDVLGTVVPIKDKQGVTSLALERPDGDTWRPLCRLTMHEVMQLPETFTSEDCGHNLLLNTGCWICRFDPAWAEQVCFTINDRIVVDQHGRYHAQVESEDWYFSRLCHELELKIGATRKVPLNHKGFMSFSNQRVWGSDYDVRYLEQSALPQPQGPDGYRFPHDVDGWLTQTEGAALAELARDKFVLEIGSYCGKSTICLAQTAQQVTSVDPHDGRGTPAAKDTWEDFLENLKRWNVYDDVTCLKDDLHALAAERARIVDQEFDLIFIDGDHSQAAVERDIAFALAHLAEGGLIAFHDYRRQPGEHDGRWDPGVTQAVDELVQQGATLIDRRGTIAIVKPSAEMEGVTNYLKQGPAAA